MAVQTNTFKGARYVPKFADPIEWSADNSYEAIESVQHNGFTYLSKQPVPAGVQIDNEEFWLLWADPNAQMEQLRQEVVTYAGTVEDLSKVAAHSFETVADMKAYNDFLSGDICHTNGFHTSGDGGAAWYVISATGTANEMDVIACGDLFANLIIVENHATPEMFGAYGDNSHDDYASIQQMFNSNASVFNFRENRYMISQAIEINRSDITVFGNGATIECGNISAFAIQNTSHNIVINGFEFNVEYVPNQSEYSNFGIGILSASATAEYEAHDIKISNCAFDGGVFGIAATSCANLNIDTCIFKNQVYVPNDLAGGYGVLLQSCVNVSIENCIGVAGDYSRHHIYVSVSQAKTDNIPCKNVIIENCAFDNSNMTLFGSSFYSPNTTAVNVRHCYGLHVGNCSVYRGTALIAFIDEDGEITGAKVENCMTVNSRYLSSAASEAKYSYNVVGSDNRTDVIFDNCLTVNADSLFSDANLVGRYITFKNCDVNYRIQIGEIENIVIENVGCKGNASIEYIGTNKPLKGSFKNIRPIGTATYLELPLCRTENNKVSKDLYSYDMKTGFYFVADGSIRRPDKMRIPITTELDGSSIIVTFPTLRERPNIIMMPAGNSDTSVFSINTFDGTLANNQVRINKFGLDGVQKASGALTGQMTVA